MYGTLCLEALSHGPRTPTNISHTTGIHLSHVSRSLRELSTNGLVECANPEAYKNRVYEISEEGSRTLKQILNVPSP